VADGAAITFALDAGASMRDVQDYVGHKDPRTTCRNDHSRDSLDATPPIPLPPTWRERLAELIVRLAGLLTLLGRTVAVR
jgi:hypothetical protein